jgi:hypothetical protein
MLTIKDIPAIAAAVGMLPEFTSTANLAIKIDVDRFGITISSNMGLLMSAVMFKSGKFTVMVCDYDDVEYSPDTVEEAVEIIKNTKWPDYYAYIASKRPFRTTHHAPSVVNEIERLSQANIQYMKRFPCLSLAAPLYINGPNRFYISAHIIESDDLTGDTDMSRELEAMEKALRDN